MLGAYSDTLELAIERGKSCMRLFKIVLWKRYEHEHRKFSIRVWDLLVSCTGSDENLKRLHTVNNNEYLKEKHYSVQLNSN